MPSTRQLLLLAAVLSCCTSFCAGAAEPGNEACAGCHQKIYASYSTTAMANASGPAMQGIIPGEFVHRESGVTYRVYQEQGNAWLTFERSNSGNVKGKRELLYYIGSNRTGRSYLFSIDGFLFESPVNWYAQKHIWDMAPAYQHAREIPLNLPAVPDCLTCHTSGMKPPMEGTENRYTPPAVTHFGVTCERCHGDDVAHANGKGGNINPASLAPRERDAICMQCHLEGTVAIARPGRHLYDFQPGDTLDNYIRYFVMKNAGTQEVPTLSQVEALAQSVCKQKSSDRMSCLSCHDPHYSPTKEERVDYYRAKCVNCHGASFAKQHHPNQPDCTSCHMPFTMGTVVAHTQTTDHRILRRPEEKRSSSTATKTDAPQLVPFPTAANTDDDRELALAWESLAEHGMVAAAPEAYRRLQLAVEQNPNDPALLSALGYLEQKRNDVKRAAELYRRALQSDPDRIDAAMNLGVIEAQSGKLEDAIHLWQGAFEHAPWRSGIGLNLAYAFCDTGQVEQARKSISRALEFNPDFERGRTLLSRLNSGSAGCSESARRP